MPSLVGSLYVSLTADYSQYQRNMRQAETVTASTTAGIRRSMGVTERSVSGLQRSMNHGIRPGALIAAGRSFDTVAARANLLRGSVFALTAAFGGLGAALTTNVISRYLDSFTGLENQMRVVSTGSADLAANIEAVSDVAQRSRSSLQAVATLYSRMAKASPGEGVLNTLRRVETINKALQLGGATAQEAASAAIQFSQAIASNRLGGEELRAVLETPLGLELAKGLDVTIGKLREMGYAGELTAEVLFRALDRVAGSVNQQFANSVVTIDQALTVADGKIVQFAGHLDDTYGITKLLTGGILGFANNLETIIPLLANVGIGLGSSFLGTRLGGGTKNVANFIRQQNTARKEAVRLAGEEAKATRLVADEAARQARVASTLKPDAFADKGALKSYQRDLTAIQKLDRERMTMLETQRNLTYQLGTVTTQTTAGAVRAADALATAQGKVNDQLSKRWSIAAQLQRVEKQLTNLPKAGVAPNWLFPADVDAKEKDLVSRRQKLAAQLAQIDDRLGRDREVLAQRQVRVTELATEAERRAATERANILVKEQQTRAALERNQARRGVFGASLRASGAAVAASGTLGLSGAQLDAASNLIKTEQAAARAARSLAAATNAARLTRQAFSLLHAAGSSLIGFLGGGWGIAFTSAIALVTILGIRSQRSAEQVARARSIMSEELAKLEESSVQATPNQRLSILQDKLSAENQRLADLTSHLAGIQDEIIAEARTVGIAQRGRTGVAASTLESLVRQVREGTLSLDEFLTKLQKAGASATGIQKIRDAFGDAIKEANSANEVIDLVQKAIASLNGQIADVTIRVNIDDPRGVFQLPVDAHTGFAQRLAGQYSQYGQGQTAARNQTFLQQQRESVMSAAGEQNNIANTPQKIRDRAQALYEEGAAYGLSREEATKLASAELNLAESTRLGAQSSRSAAKDYENFANKLAELEQRGKAAGLSDLDQEVVQFAERLKNGSGLMRDYIAAINSGDLSKAPADLLKVRDALIEIEAHNASDAILQQYGTAAQLAGVFAEKQEILNAAVANGTITAQQAAVAYADFLGTFGEFEWIGQLSSATTSFLGSVITDFENAEDAAKNFAKALLDIALQAFALKPLEQFLNGILGGLVSGGAAGSFGTAGGFASMLGLVAHDGTLNAQPGGGKMRAIPSSLVAGAPRFHSGNVKGNELVSILERGEAVLRNRDMKRNASLITGMGAAVGRGGGGQTVQIIDQVGTRKRTETSRGPNGEEVLRVMIEEVVDGGMASGRFDGSLGSRFDARPRTAKRR